MDDGCSGGAAVSEGVDVCHDIMSELALLLRRHGEVDVVLVALHLLDLGVGDGQAQSLRAKVHKREKATMKIWEGTAGVTAPLFPTPSPPGEQLCYLASRAWHKIHCTHRGPIPMF